MVNARLTLKNCRRFEDVEPARFVLKPGFTAFVGPNSSGKSSLLRSFYELRNFWGLLQDANLLRNLLLGGTHSFNYQELSDPSAAFNDNNRRDMTLRLDFPPAGDEGVRTAEFVLLRANLNAFSGQLWFGDSAHPFAPQQPQGLSPTPGPHRFEAGGRIFDLSTLAETARVASTSRYFGPFRNALNQGSGSYYDLSLGTQFVATWDMWKTGSSRSNAEAIIKAVEAIRHLFGYNKLDVSASPDQKTLKVFVALRALNN